MPMDQSDERTEQRVGDTSQRPRKHGKERGGRNRPRASLACLNCRERKTKCTKTSDPKTCASCQTLRIPCVISQLGDRRRIQSREQFSELQDRVHLLETLLSEQSRNNNDGAQNSNLDTNNDPSGGQLAPEDPSVTFPNQSESFEPVNEAPAVRRESQVTAPFVTSNDDQPFSPQQQGAEFDQQIGPPAWPNGLGDPTTEINGESMTGNEPNLHRRRATVGFPGQMQSSPDRMTISTEDEAPRLEFDQENGQSRFYGPTSQLHIRSQSLPIGAEVESTNSPVAEVKTDSSRVQEVLLQSFWESQPLSQAIIERKRYDAGRKFGVRSEYWSPFLENALLACASRMRTSPDIRALGPRFCERATSRIVEELQSPQIATIQGFLLLSDFEATRGRDRLGYLYCGIGCRMIFDLGLHENVSALVAQGRLTASDKVSRHLLFLGAYVYDTLWGLYLGRPSNIPRKMLETARSRVDDMNLSVPISLEAWVGLGTEIAEVTEVLNNNEMPLDATAMAQLADLDARISRRLETLPPALTFEAGQIAELAVDAYGLQIQFRGIRIVLHRRLSQTIAATAGQTLVPGGHDFGRSRAIMHESAVMIARLTSTYQQIFGIENVITVMLDNSFIAAALLVSHVVNLQRNDPSQSTDSDIGLLNCLSDIFQRAQKHYPVTARMLSTLSSIVEGTSMAGMFGERTHSKPHSGQMNFPTNNSLIDADWSMGLGFDANAQDGQQDSSNWFLDGFADSTAANAAPDMDPRNMMTWLLSPMEM